MKDPIHRFDALIKGGIFALTGLQIAGRHLARPFVALKVIGHLLTFEVAA